MSEIQKKTDEVDILRREVEALCAWPATDRLSALSKSAKLQQMTSYFAARMIWMGQFVLSETAFLKRDLDEINTHLEKCLKEMFEAWKVSVAHVPEGLPPEMQPKERPPLFPA